MASNHKTLSSSEEMFPVVNGNLDHLVKSNKQLVEKVVRTFTGKNNHVDKDDLVQEGFIGLIEAAKSFSVMKNTRFSTYAYHCIDWKLHKYYRKSCNRKYMPFNEEPEERESQNTQEDKPKRKLTKFVSEKEIPCHASSVLRGQNP